MRWMSAGRTGLHEYADCDGSMFVVGSCKRPIGDMI